MANWADIEADKDYQALSDADKASVKASFDAQNKTPTTSSKSNSIPSDWSTIANDKDYQALSDEDKQQVQQSYSANGGNVDKGIVGNIEEGAKGAVLGAQRGIVQGAIGAARFLGADKWADEQSAQYNTVYKQNTQDITTGAGKFGLKYGETAGDIAAAVAAPEVAIPAMAAKAVGQTYEEQAPDERSRTQAAGIGLINYAANKVLPGLGGKALDPVLSKVINSSIGTGAKDLVSKAIGETATKAVGRVATNTAIGATTGAVQGAAEAAVKDEDVIQGAEHGFTTGAMFGAGLSGAHETIGAGKAIASKFTPPKQPGFAETAGKEAESINNAKTHEERDTAFNNASHSNASVALKTAQEHGAPIIPQAVAGSKGGQALIDIPESKTGGKVKHNVAEVKERFKDANTSFKNDVAASKINNDVHFNKVIDTIKNPSPDSGLPKDAALTKKYVNQVSEIQDAVNLSYKLADKGDVVGARKAAVEAAKLHAEAPQHVQEAINNGYQSPKGFTEGFDPVAHIHQYTATKGVMDNISNALTNAKEKAGFHIPTSVRLVAHSLTGFHSVLPLEGYELANKALKARQSANATKQIEAASSKIEQAKPATEITPNAAPTANAADFNQLAAKQTSKFLTDKANKIKAGISNPDLAAKITPDNVSNSAHVKHIQQLDNAQNRELQSQAIERVAERKNTRQQAQQEAAGKRIDEYFANEGNYHNKDVKAKAIEAATKGGKLLNADRVISEAQKITGNTAKAGTREEFKSYIDNTMPNIDQGLKNRLKGEVDKVFNGKQRLTMDQQKELWAHLGDRESEIHKASNANSYSEAAKTRANKKINSITQRQAAEVKAHQSTETAKAMEEELKGSNIPESDKSDFINNHTAKVYEKGALNEAQHKAAIEKAKQAAKDYASKHEEMNTAQHEETVSGVSDEELTQIKEKLANNKPLDSDEADHVQSTIFKGVQKGKSAKPEEIKRDIDIRREKVKHFLKDNPSRRDATLRALDVMEKGLVNRAKNPNGDVFSHFTKEDLNHIEGATAWGLQSQVVETITGRNYDAVRNKIYGSEDTAKSRASTGALKAKGNAVKRYRVRSKK